MNHAFLGAMQFASPFAASAEHTDAAGSEQVIPTSDGVVEGTLTVPLAARGVVVFLHASSAGRFEARQRFAAQVLQQAGLATLQVDLLTPAEEATLPLGQHRAQDTLLMVERALSVFTWLGNHAGTTKLAVGVFATTAEVVVALSAAERTQRVAAVLSQGGCPDFFDETLSQVRVPTLLIVGQSELARAPELAAEFFERHLGNAHR